MSEPTEPESSAEAGGAVAAAELPRNYFELYNLAVEMADRISARRGLANTFFLTANTGVVAVLGSQDVSWYLAAAGGPLLGDMMGSPEELPRPQYRQVRDHPCHGGAPARPRVRGREWNRLRSEPVRFSLRRDRLRSWLAQYRELGRVERVVPWIFALIYLAEILRQLLA